MRIFKVRSYWGPKVNVLIPINRDRVLRQNFGVYDLKFRPKETKNPPVGGFENTKRPPT